MKYNPETLDAIASVILHSGKTDILYEIHICNTPVSFGGVRQWKSEGAAKTAIFKQIQSMLRGTGRISSVMHNDEAIKHYVSDIKSDDMIFKSKIQDIKKTAKAIRDQLLFEKMIEIKPTK